MKKNDKNLIGQRLRLARLMKKPVVRQKDLLARLEVNGLHLSDSAISKIESGSRSVNDFELLAFAEALNVRVLWLLGKDNQQKFTFN